MEEVFAPLLPPVICCCWCITSLQTLPQQIFTCEKYSHHWKIRCVGHVAFMGERRDAYSILVRKHEGKKSLGRLAHKHESILLK